MSETIRHDYHSFWDDHTYMYASVVDFYDHRPDGIWDGVWIGTGRNVPSSLDWQHTLPPGLQIPPDEVHRAELKIDGEFINSRGNYISIEGSWDWDPLNHMWFDNSVYSLTNVDQTGFWNGGTLDLSVLAGERYLRLDQAVLMMDYSYGTAGTGGGPGASAVPEPASLLLIGMGLVGVAGYRKLRK